MRIQRDLLPLFTFRIQQACDAHVSLCYAEGLLQILQVGLSENLIHVDQIRPRMKDRIHKIQLKGDTEKNMTLERKKT